MVRTPIDRFNRAISQKLPEGLFRWLSDQEASGHAHDKHNPSSLPRILLARQTVFGTEAGAAAGAPASTAEVLSFGLSPRPSKRDPFAFQRRGPRGVWSHEASSP